MMDTHEVLVAARNLLDREGWIQCSWETRGGRCALGAIAGAIDGVRGFTAAREALDEALTGLPGDGEAVIDFNNAPGRTKAEVLDLFDRAIAATAPPPPFESLTTEPATERERLIQDEVSA